MPTPDPHSVPLVRLSRAGQVESVHRGRFVLLEGDDVRAAGGDIQGGVFVRSSAKPIQAMAGITSGAMERFGLDARHLAIAAGSHSATGEHLDVVRDLLARADVDAEALRCGGHWSIDLKTAHAQRLPPGVESPPSLWSNCSGKHAMMLAAARATGAPLDSYLSPEHPTQQAILDAIAAFSALPRDAITVAIDGCGAPAPYLPLDVMARMLQRVVMPARRPDAYREAADRVSHAMRTHPRLVAGPERFTTDLMEATEGRVLAKGGAEGVLAALVPARDLALVVKVDDGNDRGYMQFVLALLRTLDVLNDDVARTLSERHAPATLRNHAGTVVGSSEAVLPAL